MLVYLFKDIYNYYSSYEKMIRKSALYFTATYKNIESCIYLK